MFYNETYFIIDNARAVYRGALQATTSKTLTQNDFGWLFESSWIARVLCDAFVFRFWQCKSKIWQNGEHFPDT